MKKENAVIGATKASIHKWKLWSTQNEVAMIGNSTTKIGVSKQWTAQTMAIPIPKRSNQPHGWGVDVECEEKSCITKTLTRSPVFARSLHLTCSKISQNLKINNTYSAYKIFLKYFLTNEDKVSESEL